MRSELRAGFAGESALSENALLITRLRNASLRLHDMTFNGTQQFFLRKRLGQILF